MTSLLVDIGNSRVKYARVGRGVGLSQQSVTDSIEHLADSVAGVDQVLVAAVGKQSHVEALQQLCRQHDVHCNEVKTAATAFGIHCAYENYHTLGVDRWLAMLGAAALTEHAFAVIDAGTAVTCDLVVNNQHLGGWISPGFSMMRKSLLSNTQRVFGDEALPQTLLVGRSTPDCVNMGCLASLQGVLQRARQVLAQSAQTYQIFICGGDSALFSDLLDTDIKIEPTLVLQGLNRFA